MRAPAQERRDNFVPLREDVVLIRNGVAGPIAAAEGMGWPHFGSDPDRVILHSPQQGLFSMRLDGSDKKPLLRIAGAQEILVSPDGRHGAAKAGDHVYLFDMPSTASFELSNALRVSTLAVDSFTWSGPNTLTWALAASLFIYELPNGPVREIPLEVERARAVTKGTVILRGANVITMRGDEVVRNADIVIRGNRIQTIGPAASATPPGARVMDVRGHTIMPGLIDVHGHFNMPRGFLDANTWEFPANLAHGVTTVRDPQSFASDIFAYSDLVEAGDMTSPRIYSTGPGVFSQSNFQSYEEVLEALKRYKNYYRTHLLKSYLVGDRRVRQWIIRACRELRIMPTTEGGADFAMNLTHAIDGFSGNEHALPSVPIFKDVIELYAQSGISYTPTLLVAFGGPFAIFEKLATERPADNPKLRHFIPPASLYSQTTSRILWFPPKAYIYPQIAAGAGAIRQAGGSIAMGGHGELQGLQCHWEMWSLATGMRNYEVLRAATSGGARAIGLSQDLGSLEAGKLADLIILRADPLADIRNTAKIHYVMKDGALFEADTLKPAWPESRPAPVYWWNRDQSATR